MATSAVKVLPNSALRRPLVDGSRAARNAVTYLRDFQTEFQREASADYSRVPPSPAYVRTGTLGRGWRGPQSIRYGNDYTLTLENRVRYSGYVQGPEDVQARHMKDRGWRSSTVLARAVEQKLNRRFRKEFSSR